MGRRPGDIEGNKRSWKEVSEVNRDEPWYDMAQVCLNGHLITALAQTNPRLRKKICPVCGEPTLTECFICSAPIRGHYHGWQAVGLGPTQPAAYCHECGTPYPWTQRTIKTAQERIKIHKTRRLVPRETGKPSAL